MNSLSYSFSFWLVKQRLPLFILSMICIGISGLYLPNVSLGLMKDMGYADDPRVMRAKQADKLFPYQFSETIIIATKDTTILTSKNIELISNITEELKRMPYALSVNSLTSQVRIQSLENEIHSTWLIPRQSTYSNSELNNIKNLLTQDQRIENILLSKDREMTQIVVNYPNEEGLNEDEIKLRKSKIADYMINVAHKWQKERPDLKIFTTGYASFNRTFEEVGLRDLMILTPTVAIISWAMFWLLIRSLRAVLIGGLLLIVLCEVVVVGMIGFLNMPLNQLTMMGPAIVILVIGADSVHVMSSYLQNLEKNHTPEYSMVNALSFNLKAVILTTLTTLIGFLSLNFSGMPAIQELGNITAFGTIIALIITLTVLPSLMLFKASTLKASPRTLPHFMRKAGSLILKKSKVIFWLTNIIILISLSGLTFLIIDFSPGQEFKKGYPEAEKYNFISDKLSLHSSSTYILTPRNSDDIYNLDFLYEVDALNKWMKSQYGVSNVFSYTDFIAEVNSSLNGTSAKRIPEKESTLFEYNLIFDILGISESVHSFISEDENKIKLQISLHRLTHQERKKLESDISNWIKANTSTINVFSITGSFHWPYITEKAFMDLIEGALFAFLAITFALIIFFKSIKIGVLSIIPNMFPALMVFGLWGIFIEKVNFVEACILNITIGIVVDDTVHFMSKYITFKKNGDSFEEAIINTFEKTGTAIIITTFSFCAGLLVLNFSYFHNISLIAQLMVPIMLFAVLLDFFYLPSILKILDGSTATVIDTN